MSGSALDVDAVEALLEGRDKAVKTPSTPLTDTKKDFSRSPRDREDGRRDTSRGRRDPAARGDDFIPLNDDRDKERTDKYRSRRRSTSREDDRSRHSRHSDRRDRHGNRYRGGRARSRSPHDDSERFYRPPPRRDQQRYDERGHYRDRDDRDEPRREARGGGGTRSRSSRTPENNEERDERTVFIRQLAARVRERDIEKFFEGNGLPVRTASVVTDRVSKRSKGVGYVEFVSRDSAKKAIDLTGQKIMGVPIIVAETEAQKNRMAAASSAAANTTTQNPQLYKKLFIGNIHFSINDTDLRAVFEPYGAVEEATVEKDESNGRSKGFGYVLYSEVGSAQTALKEMNGFTLASRPIRVGLGGERFTAESTQSILNSQPPPTSNNSSNAGGRPERGNGPSARDIGAASALDDADVAGVAFTNHGRDALMRKLAREEDGLTEPNGQPTFASRTAAVPSSNVTESPCVRLQNMFTAEEAGKGPKWGRELEGEIREECEEQYGKVVHISVDLNSSEGVVYVKFDREQGGKNAMQGLNGRWFNRQRISAQLVPVALYRSLFPKAG